jgi:nuclear pore complex protein Nup205
LIVSLCASVLPLVPKADLVSSSYSLPHKALSHAWLIKLSSNTGFGAIHGAILGLATNCLSSTLWLRSMRPQTDAEMRDAGLYSSGTLFSVTYASMLTGRSIGLGTETKFDVNVRRQERLLRKAIVMYLGTASDFTGERRVMCSTLLS